MPPKDCAKPKSSLEKVYAFSSATDGQTLAILHIPKTAGTSLAAQIAQSGVPWAHVLNSGFSPDLQRTVGTARDHLAKLKPKILGGAYRVIFGHMTRRDVIYGLDGAAGLRFAALVRDPVTRFVSEYAYATSSRYRDHVAVLKRYPKLKIFIEKCVDNNVLIHYLERYRGQPVLELADELERDFCFIGCAESFDKEVPELMKLFTEESFESAHLNRGPSECVDVSKRDVERILELNARDVEFFNLMISRGLCRSRRADIAWESVRAGGCGAPGGPQP